MQRVPLPGTIVQGGTQSGVKRKIAFLSGFGQPGQFLVDNPAGADVGMPHFRISHLAVRQANIQATGANQCVWIRGAQSVNIRCTGCFDRITVFRRVIAKAIKNHQDGWSFFQFYHGLYLLIDHHSGQKKSPLIQRGSFSTDHIIMLKPSRQGRSH